MGGATNASYAAWLAVCVFFMFLPEENQPSYEQINDLRYALMGKTVAHIAIPDKLKNINFGQGMAIVLFTDGRIEANKSADDVKKGLLNFVNVIELVKQLGIKLYLIVVGGDVTSEVRLALEGPAGESSAGHIFYMPHTFDRNKITEVYNKINDMEKNRLLVKLEKRKKDTRWPWRVCLCALCIYCFLQIHPYEKDLISPCRNTKTICIALGHCCCAVTGILHQKLPAVPCCSALERASGCCSRSCKKLTLLRMTPRPRQQLQKDCRRSLKFSCAFCSDNGALPWNYCNHAACPV